ncbi:zinc finger protein 778-like [Fopius arisanus]|uniref:Zinc finger protein 778-like n=1 Tax=Fopius arisanus TaxID=64838 RepID=A0A9R1U8B7_9HYME|nr:PREDICTED: zinc finger protein 778-like [Fopius arisanus]
METESITLAPPTIRVASIVHPISNETISIVIPLSAQLTTVERVQEFNDSERAIDKSETTSDSQSVEVSLCPTTPAVALKPHLAAALQKADKTKGCPFPNCSRYGRAFSRAHDLKRHIARHETRKERLCEPSQTEIRTCGQCGESFINDLVLQRHMKTHAKAGSGEEGASGEVKSYPCHLCKKRYTQFCKLQAHVSSHDKKSSANICALCGQQCENEEKLETHMKEHTTSILEAQEALESKAEPTPVKMEEDDDDDFLLEEMLLINKGPRLPVKSESTTTSDGKIRCDYCAKTFKTKWTLSSHVAAHEGRFQFGCSRCGKKFVRKSHYDGHVRSHEAARPYVCEQCGKTFKELKHRREHTKRKHPSNRNDVQNLLDSISAYVAEESSMEQTKFTLLMPVNFPA